LAGVTVTLTGISSSATTSTDAIGNYQFSNLIVGPRTITPAKAGYTFSPSNRTVIVTNINITGEDFFASNVIWAKTYGGTEDDVAQSIQETSDGGLIVAGETYSFGADNLDVWVLKLDVNGNIQWQKTYGGSGYDIAPSVRQTSDGGYVVAGETSSFGAGGADIWVLKLDGNGNIQWQKAYGGVSDDMAYSVRPTLDAGYIVAGKTSSFGAGDVDIWVLKLDGSGNVVWKKTYGGVYDDVAYSVQQTSDGGYILAGGRAPADPIVNDVFLLKLDANGGVVWQETYGGADDDVAYSVKQTSEGGFIIAGKSSSFGNFFGDVWVLKLESNGNIDWQKIYGRNDSNSANFVGQISDGGYILAGETSSFGAGYADAWVLKLDGNGDIGGGCTILAASNGTATTSTMTAANSSATVTITAATAAPTSVSPHDSGAAPITQCSSP
jgi:hypothetical protein